ncbi:MAG: zf-HC2 domain-containing protein [Candidatus Zixiibacteriota bacterium]
MRCQKVRFFLSAYCKGELTDKRHDAIQAHLKVCADCRREEALCREIEGSIGKMAEHKVSNDFNSRLLNRIAEERFAETRTKAYHPKKAPVFGWGKIVPAVTTACLVLAFVFAGGLNVLDHSTDQPMLAADNNYDAYKTVMPKDNPNMNKPTQPATEFASSQPAEINAQHASIGASWEFKKELERATRIRSLMNQLAGNNSFSNQPTRLASILTNPQRRSIVMRLPFGGTLNNGFETTAVAVSSER